AWLWNRETDASLKRARASEAELQKERDNLELTVAQRTHELKELQASRLLEMQPLAELGRIGASLIHDMSSPLTAASLQLELLGKTKQSRSLKVVHQNVDVLGKYLVAARKQLQHASEESYFDVPQELKQVINLLRYRARTTGVTLHVGRLAAAQLYGDPVKFHKIVANLIANALDASESAPHKDVFVRLRPQAKNLELSVKDYGVGIPESLLPHLFEPFYSTKKLSDVRGLGIGLAMVKQYVEQDFGGQIVVSSSAKEGTIFKLLFPLHGVKK
ncbi:MAG TPA: HAMP domain-containing sensor histidine kinase, partial [Candidatus Saccharibacteria bacterium]|nr:HAMP domain-containing sensor histidine kinase [Candidatus Saccharibacteria bacterium]